MQWKAPRIGGTYQLCEVRVATHVELGPEPARVGELHLVTKTYTLVVPILYRSVTMDAWTDDQLNKMKLGGNKRVNEFLSQYDVDKYHSKAAEVCIGKTSCLTFVFTLIQRVFSCHDACRPSARCSKPK
jgi:hypothetical protein